MPTVFSLTPDNKPTWLDSAGDPASGFQLFVYEAGTTTKATTYRDSDGLVSNTNPVVLDSRGEPPHGIYVVTGTYKLVLAPDTDTDPPAAAIWTRDDITPINDVAGATATEWTVSGLIPTYVSATQFTLVGDQTTEFHEGRRLRITDSGGTDYGVITASAYTSLTTVTVSLDSGSIDSGISAVDYSILSADNSAIPHAKSDGDGLILTGDLQISSGSLQMQKGADVASASSLLVNIDGNLFDVTGTTSITSIASKGAGTVIVLQFDGALTLTHHSTDLILPGGYDITTAAGDVATFYEYQSGDWRMVSYQRAQPVVTTPTHWFTESTTGGTETSYTWTGIPTWARRIRVSLHGCSITGTDGLLLRLGSSAGGVATSGYNGVFSTGASDTFVSNGFRLGTSSATADLFYGSIIVEPLNLTSQNIWTAHWSIARTTGSVVLFDGAGSVDLTASNILDRMQLIVTGSNTFDAGHAYGWYE